MFKHSKLCAQLGVRCLYSCENNDREDGSENNDREGSDRASDATEEGACARGQEQLRSTMEQRRDGMRAQACKRRLPYLIHLLRQALALFLILLEVAVLAGYIHIAVVLAVESALQRVRQLAEARVDRRHGHGLARQAVVVESLLERRRQALIDRVRLLPAAFREGDDGEEDEPPPKPAKKQKGGKGAAVAAVAPKAPAKAPKAAKEARKALPQRASKRARM